MFLLPLIALLIALIWFAYYFKLPAWFRVPDNPTSKALQADPVLKNRLPKFAVGWYERNLERRRLRSVNSERIRLGYKRVTTIPSFMKERGER